MANQQISPLQRNVRPALWPAERLPGRLSVRFPCSSFQLASLLLVTLVVGAPSAEASPPGPELVLSATDNDNSDWFGRSVDIYGDVAVVGAPGDDEEAINAGAAYVFRRQSNGQWLQEQKLTAADDAEQHDQFGFDVAIERQLIAVGARWDDDAGNDAGAVYLFEWNGASWAEIEKLLPDDVSNEAYEFGTAVDIGIAIPAAGTVELTNVVVGAPRADVFEGAVFLFELISSTWTRIGRFNDSDAGVNAKGQFGWSVAMRGDSILAGAPMDDQAGNNSGAAYLFGRTNINNIWNELEALYAANPQAGDQFGLSVALEEDTAVVGAPAGGADSGRVFIYDLNTTELTAGAAGEEFGSSLTVDGRTIVVGSKRDGTSFDNAGAIYFVTRDDLGVWHLGSAIQDEAPSINRQFGESVGLRDGTLIVGASEEPAFTPGSAFLYDAKLFADGFESGDVLKWSSSVP